MMLLLYREKMSEREMRELKSILEEMRFDRIISILGVVPLSILMGLCVITEIIREDIGSAICLTAMALMWLAIPIYYAGRYSVVKTLHDFVETEAYFRGIKDGEEGKETRDV